jgi:hypothetical protein
LSECEELQNYHCYSGRLRTTFHRRDAEDAETDADKKQQNSAEEWIGILVFPRGRAEKAEHAKPERVSGEC